MHCVSHSILISHSIFQISFNFQMLHHKLLAQFSHSIFKFSRHFPYKAPCSTSKTPAKAWCFPCNYSVFSFSFWSIQWCFVFWIAGFFKWEAALLSPLFFSHRTVFWSTSLLKQQPECESPTKASVCKERKSAQKERNNIQSLLMLDPYLRD